MSVLSAHCVVTQHDGQKLLSRRDAWITGRDFRDLALAATAELRLSPQRCVYKLFSPDIGRAFVGVLLEVLHEDLSALVGPMGGPAVPPSLADERTCSFDELMACVGFDADAPGRGVYAVTVLHAGLLAGAAYPPVREPKESDAAYRARCAGADRLRLERSRHEGFYAIRYDVPARDWRARDLESLLGLVHALLPAPEPLWRESGTIVQELCAAGSGESSATPTRFVLEVARGDYIAQLRLPAFPVPALVEWLSDRRCEINLCYPLVKLQAPSPSDAR